MQSLLKITFQAIFIFLSVTVVVGQPSNLVPNKPITFSLAENEGKEFSLEMKTDDYAEINWLANENVQLIFEFLDSSGKIIKAGSSSSDESAIFIAPKDGRYTFVIKYVESEELSGLQKISIEYKNRFSLSNKSKQKDIRQINGYTVRIMFSPNDDSETYLGENTILIEKAGKLKYVLRQAGNSTYVGFSFPDNLIEAKTPAQRKTVNLIRNTVDKTGDGVPDIMIDYFSGGAHCCSSTYFINLGDSVNIVSIVDAGHIGISVSGINPSGGLRFSTAENAFAYWNIHFAGSPFPEVILEFRNGELRPNFDLKRKPAPSLVVLKNKARQASLKISNEPYTELAMDFEEAFWSEMLDLIYTGHEELAWQYFDLVWPSRKSGKEKFLNDFKAQLSESYYGSRSINSTDLFKTPMRAFEKAYQRIEEQE